MDNFFRVLAIVADPGLLAKTDPIFRRRSLEVSHAPTGTSALVLAGNVAYDLIVVEAPLLDLDLAGLVATLGGIDSSSSQAAILVLTRDGFEASMPGGPRDAFELLPSQSESVIIHQAISKLLGVSARRYSRLLVQIDVSLEEGSFLKVLQSQNLSENGLLLRGGRQIEIGSKVRFRFALPGESSTITGVGRVVRHTNKSEPTVGTAVRFLELGEQERSLIRRFVYDGLTSTPEPFTAATA